MFDFIGVSRYASKELRKEPIQILVNVDLFGEGFDCPDVEFVQLARPTLSLAKYLQMVGRGLRVAKDKECCTILDNVGLYRLFGLPTAEWNWEAMFRGMETGKGEIDLAGSGRLAEREEWKLCHIKKEGYHR